MTRVRVPPTARTATPIRWMLRVFVLRSQCAPESLRLRNGDPTPTRVRLSSPVGLKVFHWAETIPLGADDAFITHRDTRETASGRSRTRAHHKSSILCFQLDLPSN